MNPCGISLKVAGLFLLIAGMGFSDRSAYASCSSMLSGTTATVTCTSAADQIILGQVFGAWYHTGSSTFGTNQFDWNSAVAGEQDLFAGGTVVIASLSGGSLIIGDMINTPADALNGTVTLTDSGLSSAQVTLDSSMSTTGNIYIIDDATGPTTVNALTFTDNSGTGDFLKITTGTGADTMNILSVYQTVHLSVEGTNGADTVNIGDAGSVQSIKGPLSISNGLNFSAINIDDHADTTGRIATYTASGVSGIAPADINWASSDIGAVSLTMGTGADTINVQAISNPSGMTSLMIQGTQGADQVNIGNAGSVQAIAAPLTILNTISFTNLLIDDSADTTGRTSTYTSYGVTGLAPAPINWAASDIKNVVLTMGPGADTVNVQSTWPTMALTIEGTSGADKVNLGAAGNMQMITGKVDIHNVFAFTTVVVDDSADPTGRNASYTASGISGLSSGPVTWAATDVDPITVNFGTGGNLVHVFGSTPKASTALNLGNGNNKCFITGSGLGAMSTNMFSGGSGDDVFVISAIPTNVTAVNIFGGSQNVADEINYTSGTANGGFPGNGTLLPTDVNAHSINYNSIEFFSIHDTIFLDGFE